MTTRIRYCCRDIIGRSGLGHRPLDGDYEQLAWCWWGFAAVSLGVKLCLCEVVETALSQFAILGGHFGCAKCSPRSTEWHLQSHSKVPTFSAHVKVTADCKRKLGFELFQIVTRHSQSSRILECRECRNGMRRRARLPSHSPILLWA